MEQWDAYTKDGCRTGKLLIRGEAIPQGLYHLVCEVLVRHIDGSYLCMKRALTKPSFPGYYEASAGGSALAGEEPLQCITRELREETGLECESFTEIGHCVRELGQSIFYCYTCTVDCDKNAIRLQDGETVDYKWMTEQEFINFVNSKDIIPTQKERYYHYFEAMNYLKA